MPDLRDLLKSLIARRREAAGHPSSADHSHVDAIVRLLKRSQPRHNLRRPLNGNSHFQNGRSDGGRG